MWSGPKTYLLEYDEEVQVFSLSTGNPKSDENLLQDVYLRVLNNKISDTLEVETKDFVRVSIALSYRMNFVEEPAKWFNVENYVKFLTDRFRSILRSKVKSYTINDFYTNAFEIIRSTILGSEYKGYLFQENNLHVYDTEVLNIKILDTNIAKLLMEAQQTLIQESATLTREKSRLEITKFLENIKQQTAKAQYGTRKLLYDYDKEEVEKKKELEVSKILSETEAAKLKLNNEYQEEEIYGKVKTLQLEREKVSNEQDLYFRTKQQELNEKELAAQIRAVAEKAKAISPDLIAALQSFSDKELLQKVAESMSPLAILGGESVSDVFARLLQGTKLESVFLNIGSEGIGKIIQKKSE